MRSGGGGARPPCRRASNASRIHFDQRRHRQSSNPRQLRSV